MLADSRGIGLDLCGADATANTYGQLLSLARALADELEVPFSIVHCQGPTTVLRDRLLARRGDASDADANRLTRPTSSGWPT